MPPTNEVKELITSHLCGLLYGSDLSMLTRHHGGLCFGRRVAVVRFTFVTLILWKFSRAVSTGEFFQTEGYYMGKMSTVVTRMGY